MSSLIFIDVELCRDGCDLNGNFVVLLLATVIIFLLLIVKLILRKKAKVEEKHQNIVEQIDDRIILSCSNNNRILTNLIPNSILTLLVDESILTVSTDDSTVSPILIDEVILTFFIDGSYSQWTGIGHAGFHSSDGHRCARRYLPQCFSRGSTETEVEALSLALSYANETKSRSILIYTDNTKVEQLISRPRPKDQQEYSKLIQILNEYKSNVPNVTIQVQRVRGHPTRQEQIASVILKHFAKNDHWVRQMTRQFTRQQRRAYFNRIRPKFVYFVYKYRRGRHYYLEYNFVPHYFFYY